MQLAHEVFPMRQEIVLELAWINELIYLPQEYEVPIELVLALISKYYLIADSNGANTAMQQIDKTEQEDLYEEKDWTGLRIFE